MASGRKGVMDMEQLSFDFSDIQPGTVVSLTGCNGEWTVTAIVDPEPDAYIKVQPEDPRANPIFVYFSEVTGIVRQPIGAPVNGRVYYTLAVRDGDTWSPQFGDYSRSTVKDELDDWVDSGNFTRKRCKIVTSGDTQAEINAAIAKLNAGAK